MERHQLSVDLCHIALDLDQRWTDKVHRFFKARQGLDYVRPKVLTRARPNNVVIDGTLAVAGDHRLGIESVLGSTQPRYDVLKFRSRNFISNRQRKG